VPASLARRHAAVVEVEHRDGVPIGFVWRRHRYTVGEVLDHWWETSAWWLTPAGDAGPAAVSDDEHERWRVEASGRRGGVVVVELAFAWSTGIWTVTAVLD
jgi:hypothetical protein